jgi:hypothetical protein
MGKFALSLHPEKTRLIEFGRYAAERRARRGLGVAARKHKHSGSKTSPAPAQIN